MCETDYSGYPDCRDDTIKALQVALNLGMERRFVLHTPLMWIDKAQTWRLARDLGGDNLVDLIVTETHTCYLGDRSLRHAWGVGCGERSEEHTSELQSLMRISYAVFCLKKKTNTSI